MNRNDTQRVLWFLSVMTLAACAGDSNRIGATISGERIDVMEQRRSFLPDEGLQGVKPVLPSEIVNFSWPQVGYDSQHGMPHVQAPSEPRVVWRASVGRGSGSDLKLLARPVAGGGFVFTMDAAGLIRCFDAKTGERKWEWDAAPEDMDEREMGGGLAFDGDVIYATTGFGRVHALDAATGELRWTKALLSPLRAAPTVADGRVYVMGIDNDLKVLNAKDGEILWHQSGVAESATLMGAASPAVQGDSVVVAYSSGEVLGLRAQNGRVSWNYSLAAPAQIGALPAIADIRGLPVMDRGRVYAISHSGRIAAIDQRSGERVWETDIGGIDTPVVAGDAVFVYGAEGRLVALTRQGGRVMWVSELSGRVDPEDKGSARLVWSGPVLAGGKLWMVNSEGIFARFSAQEGTLEKQIDLGGVLYLSPIVVDRTFFVVTDDGTLVALR